MAEQQFWIGVHGVIEDRGKILVLKRAPSMIYKPGAWDLPGGHLAANETFEECLAREVAEALGVAIAVNAGTALVYSTRVLDAYKSHEAA